MRHLETKQLLAVTTCSAKVHAIGESVLPVPVTFVCATAIDDAQLR